MGLRPTIEDNVGNWARPTEGTALLIAICAVILLLPLVWMLGEQPSSLVGAGVTLAAVPIVLWILFTYPESIPYILIIAIFVGLFGFRIEAGQINLRPNMIVALLGAVVVGGQFARTIREFPGMGLLKCFLIANGIYLFSTLLHPGSAFFEKGLADCVLFLVNVLQFGLILWFCCADPRRFKGTFRFFLYGSTVYAASNILLFFLGEFGFQGFTSFLDTYAGETGDFTRVINLGTTEGTYLAFCVVVLFGLLVISPAGLGFSRRRTLVMLSLNCGALVLTFARGPWLAVGMTMVALVGLLIVRLPIRQASRTIARLAASFLLLSVIGGVVFLLSTDLRQMVTDRFQAFSAVEVGTVSDRVQLWENMWEDWKLSPWIGHGAHDYAKFRDDPTQISENFLLEFLHSTGLVGFTVFCGGIGVILIRGLKRFSNAEALRQIPFGLPLLAGFVAMCISSLSNPGMTGGFFWAGMALLVCAEELCKPESQASQQVKDRGIPA